MSGVALIIAVVGLLLGIANSVAGYVMWRRSGPVVGVKSSFGFPVMGSEMGDQHVMVVASNTGRAAATITGWGIRMLPKAEDLVTLRPQLGQPTLPYRLEPHDSGTWMMELGYVEEEVAKRPGCRPTAWVRLADGSEVFAKQPVGLAPP